MLLRPALSRAWAGRITQTLAEVGCALKRMGRGGEAVRGITGEMRILHGDSEATEGEVRVALL